MNPKHYYHTPMKPTSTRVSCPVCHQPVYSRAGIHPQCAVAQSDPPRPRVKKLPDGTILDPAVDIAVEPGAVVVDQPPIVKIATAGVRTVGAGWRTRR